MVPYLPPNIVRTIARMANDNTLQRMSLASRRTRTNLAPELKRRLDLTLKNMVSEFNLIMNELRARTPLPYGQSVKEGNWRVRRSNDNWYSLRWSLNKYPSWRGCLIEVVTTASGRSIHINLNRMCPQKEFFNLGKAFITEMQKTRTVSTGTF